MDCGYNHWSVSKEPDCISSRLTNRWEPINTKKTPGRYFLLIVGGDRAGKPVCYSDGAGHVWVRSWNPKLMGGVLHQWAVKLTCMPSAIKAAAVIC
jgi:hypothetical protein